MKRKFIYIAAAIFAFAATEASAQSNLQSRQTVQEKAIFNASLEAGQTVTFAQVMQDPDNLKLNMAYAKTQIRNGDIKGAAATLERMLRINPNLKEVRLFYAAVLYRLDNIAEAKLELSKLDNVELSEKTKKEKKLLEKMIARREKKTTWTGQLMSGMSYDTNVNAFPEDDTIEYGNGSTLKFQGEEKTDTSYLALLALDVDHKLGKYGQHSIFAGGSYYMTKQSEMSSMDMGIISGKAGANFNLRRNNITPQLIYNTVNLDGTAYMDTFGGSLKVSHTLNKKAALYAEGKYLSQTYKNSTVYKNNSDKNAISSAGTFGLRYLLTPRMTIEAEAMGMMKDAKNEYNDTTTLGGNLRHFWLFKKNTYLMTSFSATQETYSKPGEDNISNLLLQAVGKKRKDTAIRGSLTLGFPLYKNIMASIAYEYLRNDSNIQAYTYSKQKGTGLISWKFSL